MKTNTKTEKNVTYSAPALSKGLDIIELLASNAEGLRKSDIAKALDRSISEIFRMLAVLTDRGYVSFDLVTDRYSLTTKMFEIAHRHPPIRRLSSVAIPSMQNLALSLNQSVHMAVLHNDDILIIAQVDAPGNNVTSVRLGARVPLFQTASGAALFNAVPKDRQEILLKKADQEMPDMVGLFRQNVDSITEHGYCESRSSVIEGITNISAPIYDYSSQVIAALTIPFLKRLRTSHYVEPQESRMQLVEAAQHISQLLGAGTFSEDQTN